MKKKYVQKMLTMVLTVAMICSSVPVTAETVSEKEAVVEAEAVNNTHNDSAENEQTGEDINKEGTYAEEYGDSDIEENRVGMDVDYEQEDQDNEEYEEYEYDETDAWIDDGKEGYLSYSIYQKPDGTKYAVITDCDTSAKGTIEVPREMKGIVVTGIGDRAFDSCDNLTIISTHESITNIGKYAFNNCSGLISINISEGVMSIGDGAFCYCSNLTNIKIPESVTSIGDAAFFGVIV